jgi:EAL domain-containing protein (putative c-di-GMP-specific phosphodiesterase class I)
MISSDAQKTDTIKSILDISEMLGIPIVAQGFENEADFWLLKENGFPNLQGFFTNSPLTNEQVDFFMASLPQQTKRD